MSEATLFSQTIVPGEGNDTITLPRRFYGHRVLVSCVCAPQPVQPPDAAASRPSGIPESLLAKMPRLTKEQIEALRDSPRMKELRKAFAGVHKSFPPNITRDEIREMRLKEKYGI